MPRSVFLLCFMVAAASASLASARTWTEAGTGRTIEAELLACKDGKAWLLTADGKVSAVNLTQLCQADRDFLLRGDRGGRGVEGVQAGRGMATEPVQGRKWAVLVGVDDYAEISDLRFCAGDARALAKSLQAAGFEERNISLLCDGQPVAALPTKTNIERELEGVLGLAESHDAVVVAFSGHGVRIQENSYLCPAGASIRNPAGTMISLKRVFDMVAGCKAGQKLMLVDACRNDVTLPGEKSPGEADPSKGFADALKTPPRGAMLLTSCRPGDKSYEEAGLAHGVFMHFVLQGLSGKADQEQGNRNASVSILELYKYAEIETKTYVWNTRKRYQIPVLYTGAEGVAGDWDIAVEPVGEGHPEEQQKPEPPAGSSVVSHEFRGLDSAVGEFGKLPEGWKQIGQIANDRHEIGRDAIFVTGDFSLDITVEPITRERGAFFRVELVGANGGQNLAFGGRHDQTWSGVHTWYFEAPSGQVRYGLVPGRRTLTLRRSGEVYTLTADAVFNQNRGISNEISRFAATGTKEFGGVRVISGGPKIRIHNIRIRQSR